MSRFVGRRFVGRSPDTTTIIDEHETFVYHVSHESYYAVSDSAKLLWDELPEEGSVDLERLIKEWICRFENHGDEIRTLVYECVDVLGCHGLLSIID